MVLERRERPTWNEVGALAGFLWCYAQAISVVVAVEVCCIARLTAEDRSHAGLTSLCAVRVGGPPSPAEPEPDAIHDSGPADAAAGAAIVTRAAAKPAATKRGFMFSHFLRWNQTNPTYLYRVAVLRTVGNLRCDAPWNVRVRLTGSGLLRQKRIGVT